MLSGEFLKITQFVEGIFTGHIDSISSLDSLLYLHAIRIRSSYTVKWTPLKSVWLSNIGRVGQVVLKSAADPSLKLDKYDVNIYHSVFVMAPSVEHFGGNVTEECKFFFFPVYFFRNHSIFIKYKKSQKRD